MHPRTLPIAVAILALALLLTLAVTAQEPAAPGSDSPALESPGPDHANAGPAPHRRMEEMAARLDALSARMEATEGPEKLAAVSALVEELVAQHRAMMEMRMHAMGTAPGPRHHPHARGHHGLHGCPHHGMKQRCGCPDCGAEGACACPCGGEASPDKRPGS